MMPFWCSLGTGFQFTSKENGSWYFTVISCGGRLGTGDKFKAKIISLAFGERVLAQTNASPESHMINFVIYLVTRFGSGIWTITCHSE